MKTAVFRIIGNDLPPRHSNFQTLRNVDYILNKEKGNFHKYFILNRIINTTVLSTIKSWITAKNHSYIEIKFNPKVYSNIFHDYHFHVPDIMSATKEQSLLYKLRIMDHVYRYKNMYVMNNNNGRNAALAIGRQIADIILPLDGNIYLPPNTMSKIRDTIHNYRADYYLLSMQRHGQTAAIWSEEPQLIFTNNASLSFNEQMRYGRRSKLELLWRLNIQRPPQISIFPFEEPITAATKKPVYHAGHVHRLSSGHTEPESSRHIRNLLRLISIQEMIDKLDAKNVDLVDYDCVNAHYMSINQIAYSCGKTETTRAKTEDDDILLRYMDDFSPYILDVAPDIFDLLKPRVECESIAYYNAISNLDYFEKLIKDAFSLRRHGKDMYRTMISAITDIHFTSIYTIGLRNENTLKLLLVLLKAFQYLENSRGFIRVVNAIPFRLISTDCRHLPILKEIIPMLPKKHPLVIEYLMVCEVPKWHYQ